MENIKGSQTNHWTVFRVIAICLLLPALSSGAEDFFATGLSSLKAGKYLKALSAFNRALEEDPEHARALNGRGTVWYELRAYERAISDYSEAVTINPGYANAYNNRGVSRYRTGAYEQAVQDYDRALSITPEYANAISNRGAALKKLGEYERAIAEFNRAISLKPSFDTYNLLAWTLATCPVETLRNGAGAVVAAEKAVKMTSDIRSLGTLAAAYAEAGRYGEAVATEERVIDMLKEQGSITDIETHNTRLAAYRSGRPHRDFPAPGPRESQRDTTVAADPAEQTKTADAAEDITDPAPAESNESDRAESVSSKAFRSESSDVSH